MGTLPNQTVIITGASSGIGEGVARRMIRTGANLVLFARRRERLEKLRDEIDASSAQTLLVIGDVTNEIDRARLVADTLARFGRIDGLVNNAGYAQRGPIENVPLEAIRRNFETNIFALLGLTQLVIPVMREQRAGRIVNIGSVAGKIARPFSSIYDATKHALEAFSDGLRGELNPFGIHVALIRPGFILTEFSEAANAASGDPREVAGVYAPYLPRQQAAVKRLRRVAGKADDIARVVEHALCSAHPKNRYVAPFHAKVFLFFKWIVPERVMDRFARLK
jgi:short-subunit dehydrogenase